MTFTARLAMALGILVGLGLTASWLASRQRRRARGSGLDGIAGPALLLITSPRCSACAAQKRVIAQLASEWGEAGPKVIQLGIEQEAEQVKRLMIMTVPSTVLLAPDGTVADLNNGFASHAVLSEQWGKLRRRSH